MQNDLGSQKVGDMTLAELSQKLDEYRQAQAQTSPAQHTPIAHAKPKKQKPVKGADAERRFGKYAMPVIASALCIAGVIAALSLAWALLPDYAKLLIVSVIGIALWMVSALRLIRGVDMRPLWTSLCATGAGTVYAAASAGCVLWDLYCTTWLLVILTLWLVAVTLAGIKARSVTMAVCARIGCVMTCIMIVAEGADIAATSVTAAIPGAVFILLARGNKNTLTAIMTVISNLALAVILIFSAMFSSDNNWAVFLASIVIMMSSLFALNSVALVGTAKNTVCACITPLVLFLGLGMAYEVSPFKYAGVLCALGAAAAAMPMPPYYLVGAALPIALCEAYSLGAAGWLAPALSVLPAILFYKKFDSIAARVTLAVCTAAGVVACRIWLVSEAPDITANTPVLYCAAAVISIAAAVVIEILNRQKAAPMLPAYVLLLWVAVSALPKGAQFAPLIALAALQALRFAKLLPFDGGIIATVIAYAAEIPPLVVSMAYVDGEASMALRVTAIIIYVAAAATHALSAVKSKGARAVLSLAFCCAQCYAVSRAAGSDKTVYIALAVIAICAAAIWLGFKTNNAALRKAALIIASLHAIIAVWPGSEGFGAAGGALSLLGAGALCFGIALLYGRLGKLYGGDEKGE